jgi:hypothetical protein
MTAAKSLAELTVSSSFDLDEVVKCLHTNGAAVLPGFAPAATVEALKAEFHQALDDEDQEYLYKINYQPGRAVSLMRGRIPQDRYRAINSFFGQIKMQELCNRYVGYPQQMNYEIYATHEFRPGVDIAPTHFDKLWTLKYMVYLNDIAVENGAFGVIPGSHVHARKVFRDIFEKYNLKRLEMSNDRYHGMGNDVVPPELGRVVDITGSAGTMIIFDTDTFHHAGTVTGGHERMILRAHTGPAVTYTSVRKGSRQWWRGEKRFSHLDAMADRVGELFARV